MKKFAERPYVFLCGSAVYGALEIVYRGHTHWSMALTGGTVLLLIYFINQRLPKLNIALKSLLGGGMITAVEFAVGCVVNMIFKLNVWDYSSRAYNILGQICPRFSLYWIGLSVPAFLLSSFLKQKFFKQNKRK
ncbi:MAG: putative ABC transporter permease [Clostridiales bacterium]|nr:putative ABC transporter permease [Clostridiales bacterium]